ncbi:MAG: aminoglycoside phosphotransferase family protein [Actinophytocola sp.]|uniref:phosphotransferase family protein n=1 Tax=Actinophytocola sp. TaxID=1872138 RepID=UPI003C72AFCC
MKSTSAADVESRHVMQVACQMVGLDSRQAELIRLGENAIYRLPGQVVIRVGRRGQLASAVKEVNVARWLESVGVPAVQVVPDVDQPVDVDDRPVTFWRELPPHEHGTPSQVAQALRRLHAVPRPAAFDLPPIAPFVRLEERIGSATALSDEDRAWMRTHLEELQERYARIPAGLPHCVVHGDAWVGNVVSTSDDRTVFLDLERAAIGPPEWDLIHTAIKRSSFAWITAEQYGQFCKIYGNDVADWSGFGLLRDIREFRMTCMAVQVASADAVYREQAAHRLACIRGRKGPRPWGGWHAVP